MQMHPVSRAVQPIETLRLLFLVSAPRYVFDGDLQIVKGDAKVRQVDF